MRVTRKLRLFRQCSRSALRLTVLDQDGLFRRQWCVASNGGEHDR